MMPTMRRVLFSSLLAVSACATTAAPSATVPIVTLPTDDATSVLRALDRVDAGLVGADGALQALEQRARARTAEPTPPPK